MVFHFPGKRKILSTNLYDSHLQRSGNQTSEKKALQLTISVVTDHYTVWDLRWYFCYWSTQRLSLPGKICWLVARGLGLINLFAILGCLGGASSTGQLELWLTSALVPSLCNKGNRMEISDKPISAVRTSPNQKKRTIKKIIICGSVTVTRIGLCPFVQDYRQFSPLLKLAIDTSYRVFTRWRCSLFSQITLSLPTNFARELSVNFKAQILPHKAGQ